MHEREVIGCIYVPRTRSSLAGELRRLGLLEGGVAIVHVSMSRMGWVCGGPLAVAQALLDAVGSSGTIVVPTQTTGNSDPSEWSNPPIPAAWWPTVRDHMPTFDPHVTPPSGMGSVAEVVRSWPTARRSAHPQTSFAAVGPHADVIVAEHALDSGLGERSPLARLYDLDASILLLGAGHTTNTSLHLAEYRVPVPRRHESAAAVMTADGRRWASYEDVKTDSADFEALGADFDATGRVVHGRVGSAAARLMRHHDAVDFAVNWMPLHRR